MIKRNNKKGFTIVELVIVIAVIAILAAVLIPTFSGIIRKANISADTQLVKNMNTALAADETVNGKPEDFNDVIAIVKDAGYILSAFNPTTEGCYVVWEKETNQLLLVDSKKDFEVIYSVKEYTPVGATWYFAVDSKEAEAELKEAYSGVAINIEMAISEVKNLSDMLAAGGTQEIYIDESLVLDKDNLLVFDKAGANTTINLGSAQLNTSGILSDVIPVQITEGNVTINGGVIGAAGSHVDVDGNVVNSPILTDGSSTTNINGTTFNVPNNGYALFAGNANIDGAVINAVSMGIYVNGDAKVELKDTTIISENGRCVWSCNLKWADEAQTKTAHNGDCVLTIKSGKYVGGNAKWNPIAACGGQIVIEGGTFEGKNGGIFTLQGVSDTESIVVKGGTFNGVAFENIKTEAEWLALCNAGCSVTIADGVVTITK
jgi:prepilin-type N-terminal cleavage/methylation domain-containing protein